MEIRVERLGDADAIAQIHREAFGDEGDAVVSLVNDLRAVLRARGGASLVAESDRGVLGHVILSAGLLDAPPRLVASWILSPIAVRRDARGAGIGSALIARALEVANAHEIPCVFLEGDPAYYGRHGFVAAGPLGFRKPSLRIPDVAFQVRTLAAYEPWMTGTVVYSETFWRHDLVGLRTESG